MINPNRSSVSQNFFDIFIPKNTMYEQIFDQSLKASNAGLNILIQGDTGTGKDVLTKYIHRQLKPSSNLIIVNCGAICSSLAESELFGHVKGSFTDAREDKIGKIEAAHNGILFLDEIGNMPLNIQQLLLRVIEDKKIIKIGSNKEIKVNFLLITATNENLVKAVEDGRFRQDLYYRIAQFPIKLPNLIGNPKSIQQFAKYFLDLFHKKYAVTNLTVSDFTKQFKDYIWPGNIRELKNKIQIMVSLGKQKNFLIEDIKPKANISDYKKLIKDTLRSNNYNISKTARYLGIKRTTLIYKMQKLDIYRESFSLPLDNKITDVKHIHTFNIIPSSTNFVGRKTVLQKLDNFYKDATTKIVSIVGWGGFGKSFLAKRYFDVLKQTESIRLFWWGFNQGNNNLELFLDALLSFFFEKKADTSILSYNTSWQKILKLKEYINMYKTQYLIVLDGFEDMLETDSSTQFGTIRDKPLEELISFFLELNNKKGLLLITSRYYVKNSLNEYYKELMGYQSIDLKGLNLTDARGIFKNVQIMSMELDNLIKSYMGHPLSLTLIAKYFSLLSSNGLKQISKFDFKLTLEEKLNQVLTQYLSKLSKKELYFLKVFSLFRSTISPISFYDFIHKAKLINNILLGIDQLEFLKMTQHLIETQLIFKNEDNKIFLLCLIKDYFQTLLDEEIKKNYHQEISKYFQDNFVKKKNKDVKAIISIFDILFHGVNAGLYDEMFNFYFNNYFIYLREEKLYLSKKLFEKGILGEGWHMSILRLFFQQENIAKKFLLKNIFAKSFILNELGLCLNVYANLRNGEITSSAEIFLRKLKLNYEYKAWLELSVTYQNLASIYYYNNEFTKAKDSTEKAIKFHKKSNKKFQYIEYAKPLLVFPLLINKTEEDYKNKLKELKIDIYDTNIEHGFYGIQYIEFLISINEVKKAKMIVLKCIKLCNQANRQNDLSRCYRLLGKCEYLDKNYEQAKLFFNDAIKIAMEFERYDLIIEAYIDLIDLYIVLNKYDLAHNYCKLAEKYYIYCDYKLFFSKIQNSQKIIRAKRIP